MNRDKLNQIIDFAIQREREAAQFYLDLQQVSGFQEHRALLQQLSEVEAQHVTALEKIRRQAELSGDTDYSADVHLGDVTVPFEMPTQLSYADLLRTAIKREANSHKLYLELARSVTDPDLKKVYLRLAGEEAAHKRYFEKIYDEEIFED